MSWIRRLRSLFEKQKLEDQLDDELLFHLVEMRTQEFIATGMGPEEARRKATLLFGNRVLLKERTRDMDTIGWIETLWQDLRYALRMLSRNPGFTAVAVITLALGIGANTAIFSVVNAVLLRPLYNQDPKRLVSLSENFHGEGGITLSPADLSDWRQQSRSFAWIAGFRDDDVNILGIGEPEEVSGAQIDANLFRWLDIKPLLGRTFLPEEGQPGNDRVILLGYALWHRQFGGDPSVVDKILTIEGKDRATRRPSMSIENP